MLSIILSCYRVKYGVIPVDCRVEIDVSEELAASMIMVDQFTRRHIPEVQDRDLLDFFIPVSLSLSARQFLLQ
jgi:hypothetical protein